MGFIISNQIMLAVKMTVERFHRTNLPVPGRSQAVFPPDASRGRRTKFLGAGDFFFVTLVCFCKLLRTKQATKETKGEKTLQILPVRPGGLAEGQSGTGARAVKNLAVHQVCSLHAKRRGVWNASSALAPAPG
jgi:hypothetical protein